MTVRWRSTKRLIIIGVLTYDVPNYNVWQRNAGIMCDYYLKHFEFLFAIVSLKHEGPLFVRERERKSHLFL